MPERGARHDNVVAGIRSTIGSDADDELRKPVRARNKVAIGIGAQERYREHVPVGELDAEHLRRLRLDVGPRRQPAVLAAEQLARCHGLSVHHHVFAQEDLVRGVRGVGLVLVDERRGHVALRRPVLSRHDGRP